IAQRALGSPRSLPTWIDAAHAGRGGDGHTGRERVGRRETGRARAAGRGVRRALALATAPLADRPAQSSQSPSGVARLTATCALSTRLTWPHSPPGLCDPGLSGRLRVAIKSPDRSGGHRAPRPVVGSLDRNLALAAPLPELGSSTVLRGGDDGGWHHQPAVPRP